MCGDRGVQCDRVHTEQVSELSRTFYQFYSLADVDNPTGMFLIILKSIWVRISLADILESNSARAIPIAIKKIPISTIFISGKIHFEADEILNGYTG